MANTNDMNTPTKVPCGGFVLGEGLALSKDGKTLNVTGGGSQADWNQNDETASDYIKNRPFYTGDPVETVLVEESTVTFKASSSGFFRGNIQSTFEATVGETYEVSWDGAVYECVCESVSGSPVIGNISIIGAGIDTGEPFIMVVANGRGIEIAAADTSSSHTFSISGFAQEVVKIDEKYLPENLATKSDVDAAKTAADNAQSTANAAKTAADNARSTANAALPKSGGEMSGVIKSSSNIEFPRKYSSSASPIKGLEIRSTIQSKVLTNRLRSNGVTSSLFSHIETIATYLDGIIIYKPNKIASETPITIVTEGTRLDFLSLSDNVKTPITISAKDIILQSSTANSTKKFKITVDDSGNISATEVTT